MYETIEKDWRAMLEGKTLAAVRPVKRQRRTPQVRLVFTDDSEYRVHIQPSTYFEALLVNTMRRAQPISYVRIYDDPKTRLHTAVLYAGQHKLLQMEVKPHRPASDDAPILLMTQHKEGDDA